MVFNKLRKSQGDRKSNGNLRTSLNGSAPTSPVLGSQEPLHISNHGRPTSSIAPSSTGLATSPSDPLYFPLATVHNPAAAVLSASPPGAGAGAGGVLGDREGTAGWYMTTGVLPSVVAGDDSANLARSRSQRSRASAAARRSDPAPQQQATSSLDRRGTLPSQAQARPQPQQVMQINTRPAVPELSPATEKKYDNLYAATGLPDSGPPTRNTTVSSRVPVPQQQQQQPPALNAIRNVQHDRQVRAESQPSDLPAAVAAAADAALTHRRQLSGSSPRLQQTQQQFAAVPVPEENGRAALQGYDPAMAQSRFTEQMDLVGRKSEDGAPAVRQAQRESGAPFSNLGSGSGDALPASEIAKARDALPLAVLAGSREQHEGVPSQQAKEANPALARAEQERERAPLGMSSYHREPLAPAAVAAVSQPQSRRELPVLPVQTERDPALSSASAAVAPAPASVAAPVAVPALAPTHSSPTGPREMRAVPPPAAAAAVLPLPAPQTSRMQTHGPELQTTRVVPAARQQPQPKIVSSQTKRFTEDPAPRMPFAQPNNPSKADRALSILPSGLPSPAPAAAQAGAGPTAQPGTFGNVGSAIPHYMFVTYQAHVCQECVDSDKRMHALQHGGEGWRYEFSDPAGEAELPLSGSEGEEGRTMVRKTGRKDFQDSVSLLPSSGKEGGPCQCAECLKNRETVRYAAENGLIEQIFGGKRHPASETITTTTYTTIVRAPIIEETVQTVWCEEPNCAECKAKDEEYTAQQYRALAEGYPGAVVHETGPSGKYKDSTHAKDLWGLRGGEDGEREGEGLMAGKKRGLETLLSRAGNPKYNDLRTRPSTADGKIVGGEDILSPGFFNDGDASATGVGAGAGASAQRRSKRTSGMVPEWLKGSRGFEDEERLHQRTEEGGQSTSGTGPALSYQGVRDALRNDDPEVPFSGTAEDMSRRPSTIAAL